MKTNITVFALLLCCASVAQAGVITFQVPYIATMRFTRGNSYEGNALVLVPQFDTQNGRRRLDAVDLSLDGFASADATVENKLMVPGTFGVRYLILFQGTGPGDNTSMFGRTFADNRIVTLQRSDDTPGAGRDFIDLGTFTDTRLISQVIPTVGALDAFVGTGRFPVTIHGFGFVNTAAGGTLNLADVELTSRSVELLGNVNVTYTFRVIPEPSSTTLYLLGIAAAGFLCNRHRRRMVCFA